MKKISKRSWYPYTVAICLGVLLYVLLTHLPAVNKFFESFGGYIAPVVLGCVFAYMINPLAMVYESKIFGKLKKGGWGLSVGLAMLTVIVAFALLIVILVPQLINSASTFAKNFDHYTQSFEPLLSSLGLDGVLNTSGGLLVSVYAFIKDHLDNVLATSAGAAKAIINIALGLVLSIYLLLAKRSLKEGAIRLLRALFSERMFNTTMIFVTRCDKILIRYIIFSLLDSMIIALINAAFMLIAGIPYVGLISVIIGVFNLIPTFGPIIGTALSGLLLLLINPWAALLIVVFSIILQIFDGYILKPRLFGNSLGVSGLLILVSIIVMGNIFGILGILLAIPIAAIVDFVYRDAFLPSMEKRRARKNAEAAREKGKDGQEKGEMMALYEDATNAMLEASYRDSEEADSGEAPPEPEIDPEDFVAEEGPEDAPEEQG